MTRQSSSSGGLRRRRLFIAGMALLLVAVVVVPPFININRFRRSIVRSISAGLGRPVEASEVDLQMLPLPGFVLHNLTVGEDPAYGAEPVMMAQTVTATLRASTLWHRRVEIASLHFDTPSVNLVRNVQGHWNFETLLHNSPALRRQDNSDSVGQSDRPMPFPYVEATEARINFKTGMEKLPFSLERARLQVWKEADNQWRVRIRARPARTDLTISDAGEIRGEGLLTTAGALANASIQASLEWRRVELGEISRLVHGEDDGWRGIADWTVHAQGTLAEVLATSDIAVEGFRRAEFVPESEMDISAHCQAQYSLGNARLHSLACDVPAGNGHLFVQSNGAVENANPSQLASARLEREPVGLLDSGKTSGPPAFLSIALKKVPAEFFLDLFRHIHPGIPGDDEVSGEVNGKADCSWPGFNAAEACSGSIWSTSIRLKLAHLDKPLIMSSMLLTSSGTEHPPGEIRQRANSGQNLTHAGAQSWRLQPVHVPLGDPVPATVTGLVNANGLSLQIIGSAELERLRRVAEALRIPAFTGEVQSIRGSSMLIFDMESSWLPRINTVLSNITSAQSIQSVEFFPAQWTGSLQLRNATLKLASLPLPIQLAAARVSVNSSRVEWTGIDAVFAHTSFGGSMDWQTACPAGQFACERSFALHTPDLDVRRLEVALRGESGSSDLLNLINPWAAGSPRMHKVSGTLNADVLSLGKIQIKNAALSLQLQGQTADLMSIAGKVFGGTLKGEPETNEPKMPHGSSVGFMHWGNGAPAYTLRIGLQHIQPDRAAFLWHEHRGQGTADVALDLTTQGWTAAELAQNASGKFNFIWKNGSLPVLNGPKSSEKGTEFQQWTAKGSIENQKLLLSSSQMLPRKTDGTRLSGAQYVTGTVTFSRMLHLKLEPSGAVIAGQLDAPGAASSPRRPDSGLNASRGPR